MNIFFLTVVFLFAQLQSLPAFGADPIVRIEAETAERVDGLSFDPRDGASGGALLGIHSDHVSDTCARWRFRLENPLKTPDLCLRYASTWEVMLQLAVDGKPLGKLSLPQTPGWGYAPRDWNCVIVRLPQAVGTGEHELILRPTEGSSPINLDWLSLAEGSDIESVRISLHPIANTSVDAVTIPDWHEPPGLKEPFHLGQRKVAVWGAAPSVSRVYFNDHLPALFERTLIIDGWDNKVGSIDWIFTGEHGGITVNIMSDRIQLFQRFYDSFGLNNVTDGQVQAQRHPEKKWLVGEVYCKGNLKSVTVTLDHRLDVAVSLNGKEVLRRHCLLDLSEHQLRMNASHGAVTGSLLKPAYVDDVVKLDTSSRHQRMLGFGGITPPTAYNLLSPEGKRKWWEIIAEYNLLIQREYPIGSRLNEEMSNWDKIEDATPHYYADNFPNGEISDFSYIKTLRKLGGHVFFEFWALPGWARQDWKDKDGKIHRGVAEPEAYARAIVGYCKASKQKAGSLPDVVGIQNEIEQPVEIWQQMTLVLRRELDKAGFKDVKIHMSDAGFLHHETGGWSGIARAEAFRKSDEVWKTIDYSATHFYDFQQCFHNPDSFDEHIKRWNELAGDKPFLSTEICVNEPRFQIPTYRVAFALGQLYHKNLVMMDASAICYCWTILNVVQPSYGWTRALFIPDKAHGFVPSPSSNHLRIFGAYSRRIREGMVRVDAKTSTEDLLASAFVDDKGAETVVLLNRGTVPRKVRVEAARGGFTWMEVADPYNENRVMEVPGGLTEVIVEPGAVVTLSDVPLGHLPKGFVIDGG